MVDRVQVTRGAAVAPGLRADLRRLWVATVNEGGAVGFLAPVTPDEVDPVLGRKLAAVERGDFALVVLHGGGRAAGFAFLEAPAKPYMRHWATVTCLQVDPELQGRGLGRVLVEAVEEAAREEGLEGLRLSARGGHDLEEFYVRLGYEVVGGYPAAIRVSASDYRDEILLWRRL